MTICPACQQTLPDPLDIPLRGKKRQVFDRVHSAGRYGVNPDILFDLLYANDPDGGPDTGRGALRGVIYETNKVLRQHGKMIRAEHGGGPYTLRDAS